MQGLPTFAEPWTCSVATVAADAVATPATIGTDSDDTVDVAASTAGLSLLQFNKCIRAL